MVPPFPLSCGAGPPASTDRTAQGLASLQSVDRVEKSTSKLHLCSRGPSGALWKAAGQQEEADGKQVSRKIPNNQGCLSQSPAAASTIDNK